MSKENTLEQESFVLEFIGDKLDKVIEDGFLCPYIYLHGKLEDINGFDIVRTRYVKDRDFIEILTEKIIVNTRVLINDNEYEAISYIWTSHNIMHHIRGLIVLKDDTGAIFDADKKYNKNAIFI
jgi:hypothetical protein